MKKAPLYSRSPRRQPIASVEPDAARPAPGQVAETGSELPPARPTGWRNRLARHERWMWALAMLAMLGLVFVIARGPARQPAYTAKQIDALVRQSLDEKPLPSQTTKAYQAIRGSVVRVLGLMTEGDEGDDNGPPSAHGGGDKQKSAAATGKGADGSPVERGIGSGVVIIDNGTILTNLHVVQGARRIKVTFADGHVSDAQVISVQPANDLAVLRAKSIPDDLQAATMRSTADLLPGDEVLAVGFPFGIGPSVSSGVVFGSEARVQFAGRPADHHQPDPVRCGGQPGQFGWSAGHQRRRGGRHRHRDPQPDAAAHVHRHRLCGADRKRRSRSRHATVLTDQPSPLTTQGCRCLLPLPPTPTERRPPTR